MWSHWSSLDRWVIGKMCLFLCSHWWHVYDSKHKSTFTKKQINPVSVCPVPVLICVLSASLTLQERRKNTRILKISCCISHIKPARSLFPLLIPTALCNIRSVAMENETSQSTHLNKINLVTLYTETHAFIGLFATLYCEQRVERGQEANEGKSGKRMFALLSCNSLHLRNEFSAHVTQAKHVGQNWQ